MLAELRVENLVLIERAELRLAPGLNAITGETGAGKTMLAQAIDLLLGGKPPSGCVRPGAAEAWVEGVFEPPAGLFDDPELADLRDRLPDDAGEIVLARRVSAEGRSRAFVQGRSATAADLRALGGRLISFYGQHEHRRLTVATAQLDQLDAYCGDEHGATRARYEEGHRRALGLRRELAAARERASVRERDLDLLAFEIEEIEEIAPTVEERAALDSERARLSHLEGLRLAAAAAVEALAPEAGDGGVQALLGEADRLAAAVEGVDARLDELAIRVRALAIEAGDLGGELRRYAESLELEPGRLDEVEQRLERYSRLERKHGGSVEAVLAHLERCRGERDRLAGAEADATRIEAELERAAAEESELAEALSSARAKGAPGLARAVQRELRELAMEGARFAVELERRDDLGPAGADRAEFMLRPNAGVAATPLRDTASGGELSRAMLALLSVVSAGGDATLVFDEVDAGIGGHTARAVGERLRRLARTRQVLCITHLPQVASLADAHFRIGKDAGGRLARTEVARLEGEAVVGELVRMLGADDADDGARRHAEQLLAAA